MYIFDWSNISQCQALQSLKYLCQRGVHTHIHIFRHHNHILVLLGSKVTPFSPYDCILAAILDVFILGEVQYYLPTSFG